MAGQHSDEASQTLAAVPAAELLRRRLTEGRGRLTVIAATTSVWLMDLLLARHLENDAVIDPAFKGLITSIERLGTVLFVVVTAGLVVALYRGNRRQLFDWGFTYLGFSVLQVIANVFAMIFTAGHHQGGGLASLWDVAAVYMESVLVFMFIYIFLDVSTPGGAFVWPAREGEPAPEPHIIDYLFISLNVNSTYGPTSEALISRPAKLVMALQVLLAILMLTVLIARAVSSIS
ncbi:MAG: hypothetical protein FJ078_07985 [Cyanobacteria bacterium K_DeepCast_35m_m2_155]|nr:hypothetical protein [Cyanobacteria bacterium K_DeepCast_35m_m2_155]